MDLEGNVTLGDGEALVLAGALTGTFLLPCGGGRGSLR